MTDDESETLTDALYLIERVNQVGNVFTDTLKLRGEKKGKGGRSRFGADGQGSLQQNHQFTSFLSAQEN